MCDLFSKYAHPWPFVFWYFGNGPGGVNPYVKKYTIQEPLAVGSFKNTVDIHNHLSLRYFQSVQMIQSLANSRF